MGSASVTYEAMFSMPSGLKFGDGNGAQELRRAFAAIQKCVSRG